MTELLPCPFCGGEAKVTTRRGMYQAQVGCTRCNCRLHEWFRSKAVAIEAWNTRAGRGECEFVIEDNMNESEGMGDVWFRCTNCGMTYDYYADDWLLKQSYCPRCGAHVTGRR